LRGSEQSENNRSEENECGANHGKIQRLDEGHWVASLCFMRRTLTQKRRFQNMLFGMQCKTFTWQRNID
jgi:hypothetical protein